MITNKDNYIYIESVCNRIQYLELNNPLSEELIELQNLISLLCDDYSILIPGNLMLEYVRDKFYIQYNIPVLPHYVNIVINYDDALKDYDSIVYNNQIYYCIFDEE